MAKVAAALDFGTSKISLVYGKKDAMGLVSVVGAAIQPYGGFLDDVWLSATELPEAIRSAHQTLQLQTSRKVRDLWVTLPGEYVRVYFREVSCRPSGKEGVVTQDDLRKLDSQLMDFTRPAEYKLMSKRTVFYLLDDQLIRTSPLHMRGSKLTQYVSLVMGDGGFMDHVEELLSPLGIGVIGFVPTPNAEAKLVWEYMQEMRTSVVLDTGHFTTDVIVIEAGEPIFHTVLQVGGARLEQDLSAVLRIPIEAAAQVKKRVVLGLDPGAVMQSVETESGEVFTYPLDMAQEVVEARLEDTLRRIQKILNGFGITLDESVHLYMTGAGFSSIRGAKEYISQKTGSAARIFQPQTPMTPSPSMTSVVGTLSCALGEGLQDTRMTAGQAIRRFFKEYF